MKRYFSCSLFILVTQYQCKTYGHNILFIICLFIYHFLYFMRGVPSTTIFGRMVRHTWLERIVDGSRVTIDERAAYIDGGMGSATWARSLWQKKLFGLTSLAIQG